MGINPVQLKEKVIIPVLEHMDMYSESAVNLLLGTAAVESDMGTYIHQVNGPALGIYQMEPDTHDDIWRNFISYRKFLAVKIRRIHWDLIQSRDLAGSLWYATAMARLQYYRSPLILPAADNIEGLAKMWKKVYNTECGKGKVEDFIVKYHKYMG